MRPTRTFAARRLLAALLVLGAAPVPGRAQVLYTPPPPSTLFDTSIRAAAMGGAGGAVTWGEPGVWANPATLSGVNGIGWVTGHTHVLPGVADQVTFDSQRVLIGGGGLGFSFMGQPFSEIGKARLDFGSLASIFGSDLRPYDQTKGWGVGVSPLRLIDSIRRLGGKHADSFRSYGDVALGYQSKSSRAVVGNAPAFDFDEADTYDWGVDGRLALARLWGAQSTYRLDLSGAYSQINMLTSDAKDAGGVTQQFDRAGVALHLSPAPPAERSTLPPSLPWWRPGDVPELSFGLAYDHERHHDEPLGGSDFAVDHYGLEANVLRLLSLRVGYVSDREGDIEGVTYGGGVSLPIGPWGSVGYQLASVPLAPDIDRQFRQGWSVWLDPSRLWSDAR
jgi:hypothetical protein